VNSFCARDTSLNVLGLLVALFWPSSLEPESLTIQNSNFYVQG
jgi:hypothetical protein